MVVVDTPGMANPAAPATVLQHALREQVAVIERCAEQQAVRPDWTILLTYGAHCRVTEEDGGLGRGAEGLSKPSVFTFLVFLARELGKRKFPPGEYVWDRKLRKMEYD